jgi:hypothetical protein
MSESRELEIGTPITLHSGHAVNFLFELDGKIMSGLVALAEGADLSGGQVDNLEHSGALTGYLKANRFRWHPPISAVEETGPCRSSFLQQHTEFIDALLK